MPPRFLQIERIDEVSMGGFLASPTPSFPGDWSTSFGRLKLQEALGVVKGTYNYMGGRIEGVLDGPALRGTWNEPQHSRRGAFEIVLDEHGGAFYGHWRNEADSSWRGNWDGTRLDLMTPEKGGFPGGYGSRDEGPLLSGPMLGEVSATTARIWVQGRDTSALTLTVYTEDGDPYYRVEKKPAWSEWLCCVFLVEGLCPGQAYTYVIEGDAGQIGPFPLRFAPPRGARRTVVAFGSCFLHYAVPAPIFDAIEREQPDAFLMLGDTTYFSEHDWQTEHTMMMAHLRARNNPSLRNLITSVPTLGVWNDHDFGPNTVDGMSPNRKAALSSFRRCWAQSRFDGSSAPGVFSSVCVGAVEIFLLDIRSFKNASRGSLLGQTQLKWLIGSLLESGAPIKLIASPAQVLPEFPVQEGWDSFRRDAPAELETLLSAIEAHDIRGVVFLSGGRQMGNLIHVPARRVDKRLGPQFWELTASPLANEPWNVAEMGRDRYLLAEVVDECNYGLVDVDLDRAGAEIILRLNGPEGGALFEQSISLSTLSVR